MPTPILIAGIPRQNMNLFHRCRFAVGDPAAWLEMPDRRVFVCRDIEVERARRQVDADLVVCPADVVHVERLSGERDVATAQAVAALLREAGHAAVVADRTLALAYAQVLRDVGIDVQLDPHLGTRDRRSKTADEIEKLKKCQKMTENAIALAAELIHNATVGDAGVLLHEDSPLTSERVKALVEMRLIEQGFASDAGMIVAGLPHCADCHDSGAGVLRSGEPIIVDVFPRDRGSRYWGDCTRTFVHGTPTAELVAMHAAVVEAKAAAIETVRPGATGAAVHAAAVAVLEKYGFSFGTPQGDEPTMPHGTGHGVGLEVHEAPLLDAKGGELVVGDVLTIEPGLYGRRAGGVRVEDMVVVTAGGCENLSTLTEAL